MRTKADIVTECVDAIRDPQAGHGPWWLGSKVITTGANPTTSASIWQFKVWKRGTEGEETSLMCVSGAQICKAIDAVKAKYPRHYRDIMADNCDADTYEVVMQMAVYGDVIYG